MENRGIVDEQIDFTIKSGKEFKSDVTFNDITSLKDVLPSDILKNIYFKEEEGNGFGMMELDDIKSYYIPTLTVIRKRPETNDEFLSRKQKEEKINKQKEENDRLLFLKLKARFETN